MKEYTVNQIRISLGKIMETLLIPEFNSIYSQNVEKYAPCLPELMLDYQEDTDSLVNSFAATLGSQEAVKKIILSTPPALLICFFMRYHLLTRYLCEQQQNALVSLPVNNDELFIFLLNDAYLHGLSI